jgi:hypothetical protein
VCRSLGAEATAPSTPNHTQPRPTIPTKSADRVTVMKNGQVVGAGRVQDMTKDEVLGMIIPGKCPPGAIPGPGAMAS